jgi:hypothetical protein
MRPFRVGQPVLHEQHAQVQIAFDLGQRGKDADGFRIGGRRLREDQRRFRLGLHPVDLRMAGCRQTKAKTDPKRHRIPRRPTCPAKGNFPKDHLHFSMLRHGSGPHAPDGAKGRPPVGWICLKPG